MRMLIGVAVCAAVCSAGAVRAGDDWTHTLLSDDIENPANAVQFLARGLDGRTWIAPPPWPIQKSSSPISSTA